MATDAASAVAWVPNARCRLWSTVRVVAGGVVQPGGGPVFQLLAAHVVDHPVHLARHSAVQQAVLPVAEQVPPLHRVPGICEVVVVPLRERELIQLLGSLVRRWLTLFDVVLGEERQLAAQTLFRIDQLSRGGRGWSVLHHDQERWIIVAAATAAAGGSTAAATTATSCESPQPVGLGDIGRVGSVGCGPERVEGDEYLARLWWPLLGEYVVAISRRL